MAGKIRLFLLLPALIIGIFVWFFFGGRLRRAQIRNVILISIDTCRADYLSCYGYPHKITPNIDAVAKEGVLFENVISPVPLTLAAHSSMLTGTIPPYHGVHGNVDYYLEASQLTLAEILKDKGFITGAVVSSFVMDSQFGLDQGFDYYDDECKDENTATNKKERKGADASRAANRWLEQNKDEPFFLFLHYYDPHAPYEAPEPFKSAYPVRIYAGEIAYADYCVGQVIEKLKQLGLYESTLLVITSDHGESLGRHGESTHGYFIYQDTVKVPLVFKLPGKSRPKRISSLVGLVDIVPTVLQILGIVNPENLHGQDLSGCFEEDSTLKPERYIYCESLFATTYRFNSLLGVVSDGWKYIQTTRPELYDLKNDTSETSNLVEEYPKRARLMQKHLRHILDTQVRDAEIDKELYLARESRERLEALGYVSGGKFKESFEFDRNLRDPKDYIDFHMNQLDAIRFIRNKEFNQARDICSRTISKHKDIAFGYYLFGKLAFHEEKFTEAITYFSQAVKIDPDLRDAHCKLATAYSILKKYDDAVVHWNEAIRLWKNDFKAHVDIAWSLIHSGRIDEAIIHWEEALKLDPGNAKIHFALAKALTREGETERAILHWEQTLQLDPNQPLAHNILAEILCKQGKIVEAVAHWKHAVDLRADLPLVLNNLAWVMSTQDNEKFRNPTEAVRFAEKACKLTKYESPDLLDTLSVAYAAAGKFKEAIQVARKAEQKFLAIGQQGKAEDVRKRLKFYEVGRPYREPPEAFRRE